MLGGLISHVQTALVEISDNIVIAQVVMQSISKSEACTNSFAGGFPSLIRDHVATFQFACTIIWSIWKARNKLYFSSSETSSEELVCFAQSICVDNH